MNLFNRKLLGWKETKSLDFNEILPKLKFQIEYIESEKNSYWSIIVLNVCGKYEEGSGGKPHCAYIEYMIGLLRSILPSSGIVLDLSNLEYSWGDDIETLIFPDDEKYFNVIVSDKNRKALSTLVYGLDTDRDIKDEDGFYLEKERAIEEMKEKLKKNFERINRLL
jgi:hypothetical protein